MSTPEVSRLRSLCSSPSPPLHCLLNSRRRSVLLRRLRAESPSCTTQRQWEGFLVCCSPLASGLHDPPLLAPTDSDGIRYVRAPPAVRACHCTLVAVRVTSSTGAFPLGDFTNQARGRVAALEPEPTSPRAALLRFGLGSGLYLSGELSAERRLRAGKPREGQLDGDLTKRELDVLGLLVGEMRVTQTAQSLYVALSTVRTQINSVYRKLGVSSRDEAMEEARPAPGAHLARNKSP
jgi:DNA-binding CsgD family transcriptional regulator